MVFFFFIVFFSFFFKKKFFFKNKLFFINFLSIFILYIVYYLYKYIKLFVYIYFCVYITIPKFFLFNLTILFISIYFGILVLFISDTKLNKKKHFNVFFIFFIFFISLFYINTNNFIFFFFFYELFLLPSIFLVYYLSPNKRSLVSTFYFLIWTQLGSFLVFIGILLILINTNSWHFSNLNKGYLNVNVKFYIIYFLFFGFGIKIPIWPFHYWLTKTHVEAPTFFSIYLSGFLVKIALYGFYKFYIEINFFDNLFFFYWILIMGVFDSSLKFWGQVDLKKLVAYCTIQEMNLIFLGLLWGTHKLIIYTNFFCITHALLSTIFFFLVDIIYKRFSTRSIYSISGIISTYPIMSICLIFSCINYNGFPFTLKFFVEIFFFLFLLDNNLFIFIVLVFILNWLGTISFTYLWFRTLFGINITNYKQNSIDLTKKELNILLITFFFFYQLIYFTLYLI